MKNNKVNLILTISVVCMGIMLCMLDTTIMNITLPAIQKDLGVTLDQLSWPLNIYTITFAVMTIPLGRIAEIYGKNKIYIFGFVVFCIGSLFCSMSNEVYQLIIGRAVQSLGAAVIFPTSMVIGISAVSLEKRNKIIAVLGVTQGLSAALGPSVGGIITEYLSWRWVFLINVPLSILAVGISLFAMKIKNEERVTAKNDYPGAFSSMVFLFCLTLGLTKGNSWGWHDSKIVTTFIICFVAFIAFLFIEKRAASPMIKLNLFKDRQFNAAAITVVLSNLFLIGVTVLLPTYLTRVNGDSELRAALLVTPISAMVFVFSPIAAIMIDKIGRKITIFTGFIAMAVAYYLLYSLDINAGNTQLIIACLILGFGYGVIVGPITVLAASSFTGEYLTASQSVVGVLRQVGTVLAVAIFVSALTTNITNAKSDILSYSKAEVTKLELTAKQKELVLSNTKANLNAENVNKKPSHHEEKVVTPQERDSIIETQTEKAAEQLKDKNGAVDAMAKAAVKDKVTVSVDAKIAETQKQVNSYVSGIQHYSRNKISKSFSNLYGVALFVILLFSLVSLLYKEAEKKTEKKTAKKTA